MSKHTPQWYVANMGNDHQGLVVDEATGHNIAVAYDRKDTPMLAAAPAMYEALQWARQYLRMPNFHPDNSYNSEQWARDYNKLTDALAQAEGRQG